MHYFKRLIVSGELLPGEEMPSRRQLANELKINPNTVQRAYSEMEEQRLIHTEPNRPSRITEDPVVLEQLKNEWLKQAMTTFISAIQPLDISLNELVPLLEEKMKTRKKDDK
ncbi:MAG: GntR family transcriptional regulator [Alkalibacterium sp.]|nr:GntR family transcriptional regulator [Alkalibacterium sp.]HAJ70392.1 GntR family transcriptional regulator [Alkalibacterium sp.]